MELLMRSKILSRSNQLKTNKIKQNNHRPLALAIALTFSGSLASVSQAATFIVGTTADSGPGSLRLAVLQANATPGPDLILAPGLPHGSTILLSTGAINITESVNIFGPTADDADGLIISGTNNSQIFTSTAAGQTIGLLNMTLKNGVSSSDGGAVSVSNANLVMNHVKVTGNSTSGYDGDGGGISVNNGNLTLNHTTVSGNSTTGNSAPGGGVNVINGNLTLNQTTVSDNSTSGLFASGGGINVSYGSLTLNQSTVSGNSTVGYQVNYGGAGGGGIYVSSGITTISQSTITNNTAVYGAGGLSARLARFNNTVTLVNTILSGNTGDLFKDNFDDGSSSPSSSLNAINSLFGDNSSEITGTNRNNVFSDSPNLGPLQDNGGPTYTHLPNNTSLARNAGSNSNSASFTFDQRGDGFLRVRENTVDIGAVEVQTGPFTVSNVFDTGTGSLRQAVLDANATTGADSIVFENTVTPGSTIYLNTGALSITDSVTISGPTAGDATSLVLHGLDLDRHIHGDFPADSGQTVTLENMTLQNGRTTGFGDGGGSTFVRNTDLVINHSKISANSTTEFGSYGGGLSVSNGDVTLNHTIVSGNSTIGDASNGGGLSVSGGDVTLNETTVSDNSTSGGISKGGGINVNTGNLTLNQSTVSGNSTTYSEGGGIYFLNGIASIKQSTISGNSAAGVGSKGGGISVDGGSINFSQSTVTNNTSELGAGGLSVSIDNASSDVTLSNTVLSGNTTTGSGTENNFGDATGTSTVLLNASNSLFGDPAAEITGTSTANVVNNNNPKLGPLQNNGGPTLTHLPNTDSPAINAGNNTLATNAGFTEDQRGSGFPRIINATVDIGAVEAVSSTTQTLDIDGDGTAKPLTDGLLVLRYLFGFTNQALISSAVDANATRTTAPEIENYIQLSIDDGTLDIDDNGQVEPLTDGLLVLRYLFSFSGSSLISNAIGTAATRTTAPDIEAYLLSKMP